MRIRVSLLSGMVLTYLLLKLEYSTITKSIHYSDVIMGTMASLITSLTSVYSTVHPGADQRKHQSSASLAFVWGIHRKPVNSLHKWPVTRKMFPFDDVIMTMTYGDLAIHEARSAATMILKMYDEEVCVFHQEGFELPAPCQRWEMTENAHIFLFN